MKKETHLEFEEYRLSTDKPDKKTKRYVIKNKQGEILGKIYWWGAWRQYVHNLTDNSIIMSAGCDKELTAFKEKLNKEQRKK